MTRAKPRCAAPGCDTRLASDNTSRVCRRHQHATGACRCSKCGGGYDDVPVVVQRPDLVTVMVPYATTSGMVPGYAPVSLPRAPWDARP